MPADSPTPASPAEDAGPTFDEMTALRFAADSAKCDADAALLDALYQRLERLRVTSKRKGRRATPSSSPAGPTPTCPAACCEADSRRMEWTCTLPVGHPHSHLGGSPGAFLVWDDSGYTINPFRLTVLRRSDGSASADDDLSSPPVGDATPMSVDDGCSEDCEVDENSGECRHAGPVGDARGEPRCHRCNKAIDPGYSKIFTICDDCFDEGRAPVEAEAQEEATDNRLATDPTDAAERRKRREATADLVSALCAGDRWRMSIPVHRADSDILVMAVLRDAEWLESVAARVSQLDTTLETIRAITRQAERSGLAHAPLDEIRAVLQATPERPEAAASDPSRSTLQLLLL